MSERGEAFCGWFHAVVAVALGAMSGYNALRWAETKKPRNAFNAVLYAGAVAYELHNTRLHWQAGTDDEPEMLGIGA
jgi:hypothetical protein